MKNPRSIFGGRFGAAALTTTTTAGVSVLVEGAEACLRIRPDRPWFCGCVLTCSAPGAQVKGVVRALCRHGRVPLPGVVSSRYRPCFYVWSTRELDSQGNRILLAGSWRHTAAV